MLKKFWDFLLRATKFSAQIWKTLIFKGKSLSSLKWSENLPCGCKSKKNVSWPEHTSMCPYHSILVRRKPLPAEIIHKTAPIGSKNWPQIKISYVWTLYSYQVPFNYSPKKILAWFSTTFYMYEWWCLKKKKRYLISISGSDVFYR